MTRNLKIFLGVFLLSLPFWGALNVFNANLEDFFLFSELAKNPQIFTAQAALESRVQEVLPLKKGQNTSVELNGASSLVVFVNGKTQESKVLFERVGDIADAVAAEGGLRIRRINVDSDEIYVDIPFTAETMP